MTNTADLPTIENFDLVVRAETLKDEHRAPSPDLVAALTKAGHNVALENWSDRIFSDQEYMDAVVKDGDLKNLRIVDSIVDENGLTKPEFRDAVVLGIKEIPEASPGTRNFAVGGLQVYFDHSFKLQGDAAIKLGRYAYSQDLPQDLDGNNFWHQMGGLSALFDHEFSVDENLKRTHAFGNAAGYGSIAMDFMAYFKKLNGEPETLNKTHYNSKEEYFKEIAGTIRNVITRIGHPPKVVYMAGETGRSGTGVRDFFEDLNKHLPEKHHIKPVRWGRDETGPRSDRTADGTLEGVEEFDYVVGCIFRSGAGPGYVNDETIKKRNEITQSSYDFRIVDVTCDTNKASNPFPFSKYETTTFQNPVAQIGPNATLMSIDHSPSFFPREASIEFSNQLLPHLRRFLAYKRFGAALSADEPEGRSLETFEDRMFMPVNAYRLGQHIVRSNELVDMKPEDVKNWIDQNAETIIEKIKAHIQGLPPLKDYEIHGYLTHVALGMMCVDEYTGLQDPKEGRALPVRAERDLTPWVNVIEQALGECCDIAEIEADAQKKDCNDLKNKIESLVCDWAFLRAAGASDVNHFMNLIKAKEQQEQSISALYWNFTRAATQAYHGIKVDNVDNLSANLESAKEALKEHLRNNENLSQKLDEIAELALAA